MNQPNEKINLTEVLELRFIKEASKLLLEQNTQLQSTIEEKNKQISEILRTTGNAQDTLIKKLEEKDKQLNHWKERCEAAELLVSSMEDFFKDHTSLYKDFQNWKSLKQKEL